MAAMKLGPAEASCNALLAKNSSDYFPLLQRGLIYAWTSRFPLAIKDLEKAHRVAPKEIHPVVHLSNIYMQAGQYDLARQTIQKVKSIAPKNAVGCILSAKLQVKQARYEEALPELEIAARNLEPIYEQIFYTTKFSALGALGRFKEADAALKESDTKSGIAWSEVHCVANHVASKLHYDRTLFLASRTPTKLLDTTAFYLLTMSNAQLDKTADAERYGAMLFRTEPQYFEARYNLAQMYMRAGKVDQAMQQLAQTKPAERTLDCWDLAYLLHYRMHDYDAALNDLNHRISKTPKPKRSEWLMRRGDLYGMLFQTEKAIRDYTTALELNPLNRILYKKRSEAYADIKDTKRANADLQKFESLNRY